MWFYFIMVFKYFLLATIRTTNAANNCHIYVIGVRDTQKIKSGKEQDARKHTVHTRQMLQRK